MYSENFYYNKKYLSDFNFIVCDFSGASGAATDNPGGQISFETVSVNKGKQRYLVSTQYEECLTATVQICKDCRKYRDIRISNDEYRDIARWLCIGKFAEFRIIDYKEDFFDFYFEALITINPIKVGMVIVGIELTVNTNRPFAIHDTVPISGTNIKNLNVLSFDYISDDIGFVYPTVTITVQEIESINVSMVGYQVTVNNGIFLLFSGGGTVSPIVINNCSVGEIITISHPIIESSISSHDLFGDFNYEYPKIANNITEDGEITTINSVICYAGAVDITIEYNPLVKVVI